MDLLEGKTLKRSPDDQPESFIRLVDTMPRVLPDGATTGDFAVVQAARVSYGTGTKTPSDDRTLIRYLLRHKHTTPFEMIEIKWHMMMPIATARQWIRHRTANVNEYSARYSEVRDLTYIPDATNLRKQSKTNKQGGEELSSHADIEWFRETLHADNMQCYSHYKEAVDKGIAREQARYLLNFNYNTEWYWKNDLWNTMNFLRLRMDKHAQQEIRTMAVLMYEIIKPLFPACVESFDDYINMANTVSLSRLEVDRIRRKDRTPFENSREETEFQSKLIVLGVGL